MNTKGKTFDIPDHLSKQFENVIATTNENIGANNFHVIPIEKISIEDNPRKLTLTRYDILNGISPEDPMVKIKEKEWKEIECELGESIKEKGLMQPIYIYKNGGEFSLISGQRRLFASLIIGKKTIIAKVLENKPNDLEIKTIQWIENFNRKGLDAWDAINSVREIADLHQQNHKKNITIDHLREYLYCAKTQAKKYYALLSLKPDVEVLLRSGKLKNLRKAYELNKIKDDGKRKELINLVEDKKLTQKELEKLGKLLEVQQKKIPRARSMIDNKGNRGRGATRVSLGTTNKIAVAKEIYHCIIHKPIFNHLAVDLKETNWKDYKSVNKTFKKLIRMMEFVVSE